MDAQADSRPIFAGLKAVLDVRSAGRIVAASSQAFSTGIEPLDRVLRGGFPRGTIATLEGAATSGRTALLAALLAEATRRSLAAALDDGSLYPPDLKRAGVRLEHLLVVPAQDALRVARSTDILLRSRVFAALAIPAVPLRATMWSRLCGLAQKSGALLIVLGEPSADLVSFASTRVRCAIDRVLWSQGRGIFCELTGYELSLRVLKHRRAAPGALAHVCILSEAGSQ